MSETQIDELENPVTRTMVRLDPPFSGDEHLTEQLYAAFNLYCQQAWDGAPMVEGGYPLRAQPAVVDPNRLLLGTAPLPDVRRDFADMLTTYGPTTLLSLLQAHYAAAGLVLADPKPRSAPLPQHHKIDKEFTFGTPIAPATYLPMTAPAVMTSTETPGVFTTGNLGTSSFTFSGQVSGPLYAPVEWMMRMNGDSEGESEE